MVVKPKPHFLSKSTYIRGLQCHKSLYLNKHHRNLADEIDESQQAVFDRGTDVGVLAQKLFPGGVDSSPESYYDFQAAVVQTAEFIETGETTIYEAAFQFNGVLSAVDILHQKDGEWFAYEVKSSTGITETYIKDTSLQYYVITNSGIPLKDMSLVYINNEYVRGKDLDIKQLFKIESVLDQIKEEIPGIPNQIKRLKGVLSEKDTPDVDIGIHCSNPYQCNFWGHCWKHIPEYSVFDISGLGTKKKFELYEQGNVELKNIPDDFPMSDKQWMQVKNEIDQNSVIDTGKIKDFLSELQYPLYHLDFETFQLAVPLFENTQPYKQTVFQFSLHIQESPNSDPIHKEFLAETDGTDPRLGFMENLIKDCGTNGDILVYSIGFERGQLNELIKTFPEKTKCLSAIVDRMKDLMIPFHQRWYYTPGMRGSYSLKNVLPAVVPELSYDDLEINNGGSASNAFASMVQGNYEGDHAHLRDKLLEYCKLDTFAMVKILEKLYKL